ncbi:MAG: response regulator [Bacteroidota bacterium]|nr:response regulator [Bacteroidota bacterium]
MATASDSTKKTISDLLKAADRTIKEEKLDEALDFVNRVFEVDEKNVYARAYRERILALKKSAEAREKAEAKKKADNPIEEEKPSVSEAAQSLKEQKAAHPIEEANRKKSTSPRPEIKPPQKPLDNVIKRSPAARDAYKTLLREIWKDGTISAEEQERIDTMQATFDIAEEEHTALERDVRIQLYLAAVHDASARGITAFDDLRQKFKITDNEHRSVESTIQEYVQLSAAKGTVLALDDDASLLSIVRDVLQDEGYTCYTAPSGEEGLELLETITPDIVLCDINFAKPHMSGFAFYEKFRALERFINVPFIFLSALTEDVVVRTGKQMGVDDYLTKPFDPELLLVTIEGKLKRARELKYTFNLQRK